MSNKTVVEEASADILKQSRADGGDMNYDDYIDMLGLLDKRQIVNIILSTTIRFERSDKDLMQQSAEELYESVPQDLRCLLAIPGINIRRERFLEFIKVYNESEDNFSPKKIFWDFVSTFETTTYHRAIRIKSNSSISFSERMFLAPGLSSRFDDFGDSTYYPIGGDFEEGFFYHVYNGNRKPERSPFISWSEDPATAQFAATERASEKDPGWFSDPMAGVLLVTVQANSFFFLDETEVYPSSKQPKGREAVLFMSLPFKAIENGSIGFQILSKEKLKNLED